MRNAGAVALLACIAFVAFAGCSLVAVGGGEENHIIAGERGKEMYFEPTEITVFAGEEVTFVIHNESSFDHEFESSEKGEAGIDEILIPPGRTRRVPWTAPSTPETYKVYCDLPGHRAAGMELTLIVVERATP